MKSKDQRSLGLHLQIFTGILVKVHRQNPVGGGKSARQSVHIGRLLKTSASAKALA